MINIQENINLKQYSTFRVGGKARFFVEVASLEEFQEAFIWTKENNQEMLLLGGGSNIIFSDDGFSGLVVKFGKGQLEQKENILTSWAGNNLIEVINFAKENELAGMENLFGIPGTIGGAVFGNAGAFETEIGNLIQEVQVFDLEKEQLMNFSQNDCVFTYRNSIFKKNKELVVLSASFQLEKGERAKIEEKIEKINQLRGNKQPKDWIGSSGSFFQNPETENEKLIEEFEKEKKAEVKNSKLPAGWLIEKAGLLGKQIGGVKISEKNGNFITNTGEASAEEVIMMISLIKQQVRDKFQIELKEEVQLLGFE